MCREKASCTSGRNAVTRLAHSRVDGYISPCVNFIRNGRSHGAGDARTDHMPCDGTRKVPGGTAAVSGPEVVESMHVPVCGVHRRMVRAASGASRQEVAMQGCGCEPPRLSSWARPERGA
ncbi:hypothetical protein CN207_05470 [Sinorhizobium meliloti]|nr:hypothetical protein CN207_05470 [Sinorhizobium meliloti]